MAVDYNSLPRTAYTGQPWGVGSAGSGITQAAGPDGKTYYYVPGNVGERIGTGGSRGTAAVPTGGIGTYNYTERNPVFDQQHPGGLSPTLSKTGQVYDYDPFAANPLATYKAGGGGDFFKSDLFSLSPFAGPFIAAGINAAAGVGAASAAGGGAAAGSALPAGIGGYEIPAGVAASGAGASLPAATAGGAATGAGIAGLDTLAPATAAGAAAPAVGSTVGTSLLPEGAAYAGPSLASGTAGVGLTAPPAAATTLGTGTSALSSSLPSWLTAANVMKYGVPLAGLGIGLTNSQKTPEGIDQLKSQANTLGPLGLTSIQNAQNGVLTPGQQASMDKWKSDQISAASQYLANSGLGGLHKGPDGKWTADSTAGLSMLANIDQQASAISQGFLNQTFQQGIATLGVGDQNLLALVQLNMQKDRAFNEAIGNFMQTYGFLQGWGQ